jgi:hypothetical protein
MANRRPNRTVILALDARTQRFAPEACVLPTPNWVLGTSPRMTFRGCADTGALALSPAESLRETSLSPLARLNDRGCS